MKIRSIFLFISCALFFNCAEQTRQHGILKVDLDSLQTTDVDFSREYIAHKNFEAPNEADTLHLSKSLISVKKSTSISQAQDPEHSDAIYSRVEILDHGKLVYSIDSLLTTGMYCYDDKLKLLTLPVVLSQEIDDFQTENDLYLCNITSGICEKINSDPLANSSFALICPDGKHLIYADANILYSYDIANKKSEPVVEFTNPLISIFKMDYHGGKLGVYYFNNFAEDYFNDVPMRKVEIPMPNLCCKAQ